jgi:FKBP-type peptidyl-prolyl cis-trans isomerase
MPRLRRFAGSSLCRRRELSRLSARTIVRFLRMNALLVCAAALLGGAPVPAALAASVVRKAPQDPAGKQDPASPAGIPDCQDMKKTASGLEIGFLQKGRDEAAPSAEDTVKVHYTGWLLDGTKFDSSRDRGQPATFAVGGVIKGWTEGLQLMTPGARCKLVIPGDLAYGAAGRPPKIPSNATLVFDVELLAVVRMPKMRPATPEKQQTMESGVKWETVTEGKGDAVSASDGLALRYAIWKTSGQLIDCSERHNNQPLGGTLDSLPFPFLKDLAAKCRIGTVIRAEVGQKLFPNAGADTVWELELLKLNSVPKFRELDREKTVTTQSGLKYEVIEQGKGESPKASDTVTAHYTGWLTDGSVFDSSHARGEPIDFPLNGVIPGWTEGLQLMQVGGKYLFSIPGNLAYGPNGSPPKIPANATLVFLVELVAVKKQ